MKKLDLTQMENFNGGGGWACAANLALLGLGAAAVVAATGGWAIVAGFAYIVQIRDTSMACLGAS